MRQGDGFGWSWFAWLQPTVLAARPSSGAGRACKHTGSWEAGGPSPRDQNPRRGYCSPSEPTPWPGLLPQGPLSGCVRGAACTKIPEDFPPVFTAGIVAHRL